MRGGPEAYVLGVGNILWADEGFGVRCAEMFGEKWRSNDDVEIVDGGTQGLSLVNDLADAKRILIFDAVDAGLAPAELVTVRGADVPKFAVGKKVSLHQTSMMELLALAEFMGGPPLEVTLIGCQPVELEDYGGGLRDAVAAQVGPAVAVAEAELSRWGVSLQQRRGANASGLMPGAVEWRPYEAERPTADAACRIGDERVLARHGGQSDVGGRRQ